MTQRPALVAAWLGTALLILCGAAQGAERAAPVQVVMPEVGAAVRSLDLSGSFTARRAAQLSPRISGLVAEVGVDAGDRVDAGDVLMRLDDRLAELEVARAEAAVEERRAALAEAERLRDEGSRLSRDDYLPETEAKARQSNVALAAAALSRAEIELATARERLRRHTVVAPFDGTIARRMTEVGEWVETGTAVAELVDTDALWLDVQAPQQYWPELGPEAQVTATADALPERSLNTRVHARVPVSDPSARTFLVRLVASDPGPDITPGMSARARFRLDSGGDVIRVPRDALIRYPDGTTTVWVVDHGEDAPRAREVEVSLGRYVGDQVEIASGLEPTRAVVVRGNEVITQDQRVRVVTPGGG